MIVQGLQHFLLELRKDVDNIMKRILLGIWLVLITLCLSACNLLPKSKAAYYRDELAAALKASDVETVYGLFAEHVRDTKPELFEDIQELFHFIDGDILEVSFDNATLERSYRSASEGESFHMYQVPIRIKTSTSDFRIAFMYYTDNLKHPDMVGILYIHILRGEQIAENTSYHGMGTEYLGIEFDARNFRD